jgi:MFS family permease
VQGLSKRAAESARSFGEVFRNPDLRRLQLAWAGSLIGNWSYFVALAVYAYDQGGATAVGLVGVIRMLPAAVASPFLATLADRHSRRLVMVVADIVRAALMVLAAVTIWRLVAMGRVRSRRISTVALRLPPGAGAPAATPGAQRW